MSSPTLSAGLQQLYDSGLLPSNVSTSVLNSASADQLNTLVQSNLQSQEAATLLGTGSSSSDSVSLSSAATDSLTTAVNNALTAKGDAAVAQFLPSSSSASDSSSSGLVNLLA